MIKIIKRSKPKRKVRFSRMPRSYKKQRTDQMKKYFKSLIENNKSLKNTWINPQNGIESALEEADINLYKKMKKELQK